MEDCYWFWDSVGGVICGRYQLFWGSVGGGFDAGDCYWFWDCASGVLIWKIATGFGTVWVVL